MNRFRKLMIGLGLIVLTLGVLTGIRQLEKRMDNIVDQQRLRFSGTVKEAPPMVAFASMALGSFRGLVADILWLRSEGLKQQKSYYEMIQLARWITDLQPNYSGGTAYLAWNLAYNISVTCSDHEERWRWVKEGLDLIRDKAMVYNPEDPALYRELSWIYLHKVGNVLDDAQMTYKKHLAADMTQVIGNAPDWEAMAKEPATKEEFLTVYTPDHKLWAEGALLGFKDYDALFLDFKNRAPAALDPRLKEKLGEKSFAAVDNSLRAQLLRERMKLDARRIAAINRRYGKLDWRVPESQAIYWGELGIEKAPGQKDIKNARNITQALQASFRGGRILTLEGKGNLDYIQCVPNLEVADAAYQAFLDSQNEYDPDVKVGSTFQSARINYLKDAIVVLYVHGNISKAQDFFKKLIKEDGPQKQRSLEEFVMVEFAEDIRDADVRRISGLISELIFRAITGMIWGDPEAAVANERLARYIHRRYTKDNNDVKRNQLPSYVEMKAAVVRDCERRLPPAMVTLLKSALERERAEAAAEVTNDKKAIEIKK